MVAIGEVREVQDDAKVLWSLVTEDNLTSYYVLQVVIRGTSAPILEKRYIYKDRKGLWRPGDCRGLGRMDLELVLAHVRAIAEALKVR